MSLPDSEVILFLVVVYTEVKNRSRPVFVAEKKAVVEFVVIVVIVRDQAERERAGQLKIDALTDDVHFVLFYPAFFPVEPVVPEIIEEPEVGERLDRQPRPDGSQISEIGGIFVVVDACPRKSRRCCRPAMTGGSELKLKRKDFFWKSIPSYFSNSEEAVAQK